MSTMTRARVMHRPYPRHPGLSAGCLGARGPGGSSGSERQEGTMRGRIAGLGALCALVMLATGAATAAAAPSATVVVSQVYGGGGNMGATYTNDFVELFNRGSSDVSLNGW